jgi:hypothetical protein
MGWDPWDRPELLNFSLSFDVGIRRRANESERRQMKGVIDDSEFRANEADVASDWFRNAGKEEIEALKSMIGE